MSDLPTIHPVGLTWWEGNIEYVKCPTCGNVTDIQNYDCLGADPDCVFCNQCHQEIQL